VISWVAKQPHTGRQLFSKSAVAIFSTSQTGTA
jgi:hypothetical protein